MSITFESRLSKPVAFGLAGLGGFAASMTDLLLHVGSSKNPKGEIVIVSDPRLERFSQRVAFLRQRGVEVTDSFDELLQHPKLEAVWLPLPIHLHRTFVEKSLRAGKGVLCEKPAAGCVQDVDAMIAARDAARRPVAIGFQDFHQPSFQQVKRRLIEGEFGKPLEATVLACWPRGENYYKRNDWAGRIKVDDSWVLDSPLNNAMAHFLHVALQLLSTGVNESAEVACVDAELYRANPIENFDTCTLRYKTREGCALHVAMTHACIGSITPEVDVYTGLARIEYRAGKQVTIQFRDGRREVLPLTLTPHDAMVGSFHSWMRSGPGSAPGVSLEMARTHTQAVNLASEAVPVRNVPTDQIKVIASPISESMRVIADINLALRACIVERKLLSEIGLMNWASPGGSREVSNRYTHFAGPAIE